MAKTLIQSVASELQKERKRLEDEVRRVIAALRGNKSAGKKRTMSAAGRKRIAAAQRARWAKVRAANSAKK